MNLDRDLSRLNAGRNTPLSGGILITEETIAATMWLAWALLATITPLDEGGLLLRSFAAPHLFGSVANEAGALQLLLVIVLAVSCPYRLWRAGEYGKLLAVGIGTAVAIGVFVATQLVLLL